MASIIQVMGSENPLLRPIKNGWAASGKGWAVHGATRDEALEKFYQADQKHKEIEARPFWHEVLQKISQQVSSIS